jgi:hypothetical protein
LYKSKSRLLPKGRLEEGKRVTKEGQKRFHKIPQNYMVQKIAARVHEIGDEEDARTFPIIFKDNTYLGFTE